ncbi:MAG TPA: hypothetical protein VLL47_09020 [Robiginitalea sp.]|nr:hypothetical protein [Robiginitalea sp.]
MSLLDTRHKKKSFTLTTVLLSALILLLFYLGLTYFEPPIENGITVNFGTMEFGMGDNQPLEPLRRQQPEPQEQVEETVEAAEPVTEPEPEPEAATPEAPAEKLLTKESEEAIKIKQAEEAKRKAEDAARKAREEAQRIEREKQAAAEAARREQEAKKAQLDALMGGLNNADGTAQGSEGDDNRASDKGQPDGDPYARTYYGAPGTGTGTGGYGLSGRTRVGYNTVKQDCNQEGRVVVQIVVNRQGQVVQATPGVRGTTNNDPCLLEPARKTAMSYKWNADSKAPDQQIGFVVVNFKLGQ